MALEHLQQPFYICTQLLFYKSWIKSLLQQPLYKWSPTKKICKACYPCTQTLHICKVKRPLAIILESLLKWSPSFFVSMTGGPCIPKPRANDQAREVSAGTRDLAAAVSSRRSGHGGHGRPPPRTPRRRRPRCSRSPHRRPSAVPSPWSISATSARFRPRPPPAPPLWSISARPRPCASAAVDSGPAHPPRPPSF